MIYSVYWIFDYFVVHLLMILSLFIYSIHPCICKSIDYTLWLFNIAMENCPFIDGLSIKNAGFPWRTVSHNQMVVPSFLIMMAKKNSLYTWPLGFGSL